MPKAAEVLQLDLDHTGCIAAELDSGAARWETLGFTLTPVSRQRGAVPGREGFHAWATANRCAILRNTYLELIGTVDRDAFNPWAHFSARGEGLYILALRCAEADVAYSTLSARADAWRPPVPRERVLDVDGEPRTMRFRNIFSRDEVWPEARYLVIEHQTPEYLWQPRYQAHENGACDLVSVTLLADDTSQLLARMKALGAQIDVREGACTASLPGRGVIRVSGREHWQQTYGVSAREGMQAMTISFRDLDRTIDLLEKRGVRVHRAQERAWLAPGDTNGFVMELIQENTGS